MAARYFFNSPTDWANALVAYLLCAVIFLAMPSRRAAAPIAITIFVDRAAPARRHLWRALLATISAATCFAVFWISASATWVQFRDGVLTVATCDPKWWISIFIAYGLLSALYFLREALDPDSASPEIVTQ